MQIKGISPTNYLISSTCLIYECRNTFWQRGKGPLSHQEPRQEPRQELRQEKRQEPRQEPHQEPRQEPSQEPRQ